MNKGVTCTYVSNTRAHRSFTGLIAAVPEVSPLLIGVCLNDKHNATEIIANLTAVNRSRARKIVITYRFNDLTTVAILSV